MSEELNTMLEETRDKLQEHLRAFNQEMFKEFQRLRDYEPPIPEPEAVELGPGGAEILAAADRFASGMTQVEILKALVEETGELVPRALMLIRKGGQLHGWASEGFGPEFKSSVMKRIAWPTDRFPELLRVTKHRESIATNFSDLGDISEEISGFDGFTPFKSCFFPLVVKGKVAAVLYVDSGSEAILENQEIVQVLCRLAGLELTALALLGKKGRGVSSDAEPAPAPPRPAEPEAHSPRAAHVLSPVEPEPHPGFHPENITESKPLPKLEPSDATLDDFKADLPDLPSEPSFPESQGEDGPNIKKAKRVARVLVSDLKLYNEQVVEAANGNLYTRLKEDIDRSYEHYRDRTRDLVGDDVNFFREEIIKQLGGGDPAKVGPLPF